MRRTRTSAADLELIIGDRTGGADGHVRLNGFGIGGIRPTMDEMSDKQMLFFRHAD